MYLYILKSEGEGGFYIGISEDAQAKLIEHNNNESAETYIGKHRPWTMAALFEVKPGKMTPKELVTFIKRRQEFNLVENLVDPEFVPADKLQQLERVSKF